MPPHGVSLVLREPAGESADRSALNWRVLLGRATSRLGRGASRLSGWRDCLASLGLVGLVTALALSIEPVVGASNLIVLYVLGIVFTALYWGSQAAVISAVSSALLFDYLFVPPYRNFAFNDKWYVITEAVLMGAALVIGILAATALEEARAARSRETHMTALYSFTEALAADSDLNQILASIERHIVDAFRRPIAIWLPAPGGLAVRFRSANLVLDGSEGIITAFVFESGHAAGHGTSRFSKSEIRYVAMKTAQGVVGVLGFLADGSKEPLSPDEWKLLEAFVNQAAMAITRAGLAEEAHRAEVLQQTDKLQKALLNTVSHDLRTPLATIIGALDSILLDRAMLDEQTQTELLETARVGAGRLNQLVHNLLDMTRLEGGATHVRKELCDVQDVVGAALEQVREAARGRSISIAIDRDLPFVTMDAVLIVQVLVNLLDNALKYSPGDAPIAVEAGRVDGQLRIRVTDGGPGIAEQDLERVFEKFFRGSPAGGSSGAGLGLSICKGFVEAHGGRIWAARGTQGGTEMVFALPLDGKR
jgi:two-component system sensor histidine kinase KdpD